MKAGGYGSWTKKYFDTGAQAVTAVNSIRNPGYFGVNIGINLQDYHCVNSYQPVAEGLARKTSPALLVSSAGEAQERGVLLVLIGLIQKLVPGIIRCLLHTRLYVNNHYRRGVITRLHYLPVG